VAWKPYLKKFAAYYYNRAAEWGAGVAINYKYNAYAYGSAVYDLERGQLAAINPRLWQTDTAVAKNSWGYTENNDFKKPVDIVGDLIDIVSKNGVLLLNIGPRPDGSITDEDRKVLLAIGEWLKKNGEGIYGTTFWQRFGEGPTEVIEGAFKDTERPSFTPQDFRFTYKNGTLYAFVMKYPKDGRIVIPSLKRTTAQGTGDFDIVSARVLGYDAKVDFSRDTGALTLEVKGNIETEYPVGFAIALQ
jgi:alpha-L-fucosidase